MITCKKASQLISQSLDNKLSFKERFDLRLHLLICKYCKRFGKQLKTLRTAFKQLSVNIQRDENVRLPSDAQARIADMIKSTHIND